MRVVSFSNNNDVMKTICTATVLYVNTTQTKSLTYIYSHIHTQTHTLLLHTSTTHTVIHKVNTPVTPVIHAQGHGEVVVGKSCLKLIVRLVPTIDAGNDWENMKVKELSACE